ncbi:MAG: polysaccharide pyruvyl transferase family protein [Thermomicrobiales bacterium]
MRLNGEAHTREVTEPGPFAWSFPVEAVAGEAVYLAMTPETPFVPSEHGSTDCRRLSMVLAGIELIPAGAARPVGDSAEEVSNPGPFFGRLLEWSARERGISPDAVAELIGRPRGAFPVLAHPLLPLRLVRRALLARRARDQGEFGAEAREVAGAPPVPAGGVASLTDEGIDEWAGRALGGGSRGSVLEVLSDEEERRAFAVLLTIAGADAPASGGEMAALKAADDAIERHALTELDVLQAGGDAQQPVLQALAASQPLPVFVSSPGKTSADLTSRGNPGDAFAVTAAQVLSGRGVEPRGLSSGRDDMLLFTVGSVLTWVGDRGLCWGIGTLVPMRSSREPEPSGALYLGVRGPRTRDQVLLRWGANPAVIGDPGLLLKAAVPSLDGLPDPDVEMGVIAHRSDGGHLAWLFPDALPIRTREGHANLGRDIARCRMVVSSSLHGMIFAHSLGKPVLLVDVTGQLLGGDFKFTDYLCSIGDYRRSPRTRLEDFHLAREIEIDAATRERLLARQITGFPLRG